MAFTIRNRQTGQLLQMEGTPGGPLLAGLLSGFEFVGFGGIETFGGPVPIHSGPGGFTTTGLLPTGFQDVGLDPTVSGVAGDLIKQGVCMLFPSMAQCQGMFPNTMGNPFQDVPNGNGAGNCPPAGPCPPGKELRTIKARAASVICAKKPRMNVLNPRALRRAAKRLGGFQKEVKAVEKIINKALPRKTARRSTGARCGTCRQSPCGC